MSTIVKPVPTSTGRHGAVQLPTSSDEDLCGKLPNRITPVPPQDESGRESAQPPNVAPIKELDGLADKVNGLTTQNMDILCEQEMEAAYQGNVEFLRNVFDSMATDGRITLDQLPFVLVGAEVQASPKEIGDAIEEHIPDADDGDALLDFQQVETLFQQLNSTANMMADMDVLQNAPAQLSLWQRFKLWYIKRRYQRQQQMKGSSYERHMKPTTRLLLVILSTSCTISCVVVLLAILFIWQHSEMTVHNHVLRNAELMMNGMDLFGREKPFERYIATNERLASLMALLVEDLGYKSTKLTLESELNFQRRLLSGLLDGWYDHEVKQRVSLNAMLMRGLVELISRTKGAAAALALIDRVNLALPPGHEAMLGRVDNTSGQIQYLTDFRFKDQCDGECMSDPTAANPMWAALLKGKGSLMGPDYRPRIVTAGYTYLPLLDIGLVYKIDQTISHTEFEEPVTTVVDNVNNQVKEAGHELVLAKTVGGKTKLLTRVDNCGLECLLKADVQGSVLTKALRGEEGTADAEDFDGARVLEAYGPLPQAHLGVVVKKSASSFLAQLYGGLGYALDVVNQKLEGTLEVQMATAGAASDNRTDALRYYTQFKFPAECVGDCATAAHAAPFMQKAALRCETGAMVSQDYRGQKVTAGYACLPVLGAGLTLKIDHEQIMAEGLDLTATIAAYENNVRFANSSTEFIVAQRKQGVTEVKSSDDYTLFNPLKHAKGCSNSSCTADYHHLMRALRGDMGVESGYDYSGKNIIGAYTYVPGLDMGVVVQVDSEEAQAEGVALVLRLTGCSVAAVVVGMIVLFFLTGYLLKSMDQAWEEGKRAVEQEKQLFCNVITAMYPSQVAKRVLAGETQIVYTVPTATVFFSDIYEFTTASNAITPEELIQFMSYTFGVMDAVADHYHIHKVKTIGDAYLGVAGLPGSEPLTGNAVFDMLLFASCCTQVFSERYLHPEDGAVLGAVTKAVFGPGAEALPRAPSGLGYKNPALGGEAATAQSHSQVQCVMRYGMAAGPITAGVLQGKTPLFDIWGKTVNLASRMESTGQPGRIQVSEVVHHAVVKVKDQPFTFDTRHKVFCKGFGSVNAYFLHSCTLPPPEQLLDDMGIRPNLGNFYFETAVQGLGAGSRHTASGVHPSMGQGSSTGRESTHSGA